MQQIALTRETFKIPPMVYMVQNDTGRVLKMVIRDAELAVGDTAIVAIHRSDDSYYSIEAERVSGENAFTADMSQALTQPGLTKCQLKVTASTLVVSTYTFIIHVEESTNGIPVEQLGITLQDLQDAIMRITTGALGQPQIVTLASQMTDQDTIYLYLGSEEGCEYGDVYAYIDGSWTDTGIYGQGMQGQSGFSPIASVEQTQTGATIIITDENGTTTADIANGQASDAQVSAWLSEHPEATTTVQDGSVTPRKTNFWDIELIEGHYKSTGYTNGTLNFNTGAVTENASATTMVTDLLPLSADCFTTNFVVFAKVETEASGAIANKQIVLYKDGVFVKKIAMSDLWSNTATVGQSLKIDLTAQGTIEDFNQLRAQINVGNEFYYSGDSTINRFNITDLATETYTMTNEVKELLQEGLQIGTPDSVTEEMIVDGAVSNAKIADETIKPWKIDTKTANLINYSYISNNTAYMGGQGQCLGTPVYDEPVYGYTRAWITDYLPVVGGETYVLSFVPSHFRLYAWYENYGDTAGIGNTSYYTTVSDEPLELVAPDNAKYIRLSGSVFTDIYDRPHGLLTLYRKSDITAGYKDVYSFPWLKLTDRNRYLSSLFNDKIILATGDSITENNTRNDNKSWCEYLPEKLGVKVYNDGKSGTGLVKNYQSLHSILYRVENNWDTDYAGVTPDIILIMGNMNDGTGTGESNGLNDLGISGWKSTGVLDVGTEADDINTQSVYGCAKRFLEDVITKYPSAQIGWILSTPRRGSTSYWVGKENQYGHGWFHDYCEAIKYQCQEYNVPVLDLYHNSGFKPTSTTNMNAYMDDGTTHPNTAGIKKYMVDPIVKWIEENFGEVS